MIASETLLLHESAKLWLELAVKGFRGNDRAITVVAPSRIEDYLDFARLLGKGGEGKLWSLHLNPLAAMHIELGNLPAAQKVSGPTFLHEATEESSAEVLGEALLTVLERRMVKMGEIRTFPICWLSQQD